MKILTKEKAAVDNGAVHPELMATLPRVEVQFDPVITMDDDQFFEFCQINRDLRIERTATGKVSIMSPAGGETGSRNASLTAALYHWAKRNKYGIAFDSSTGFILPNGAMRSPDGSWVLSERLTSLSPRQKQKFLPLCPDFVIELRSPTDEVADLKNKMQEYMANGARLGWLLVPETREVYIYRPGAAPEQLQDPAQINGEAVAPGFTLDLADIWDPGF
jgi:Uma2 family endonuclease